MLRREWRGKGGGSRAVQSARRATKAMKAREGIEVLKLRKQEGIPWGGNTSRRKREQKKDGKKGHHVTF